MFFLITFTSFSKQNIFYSLPNIKTEWLSLNAFSISSPKLFIRRLYAQKVKVFAFLLTAAMVQSYLVFIKIRRIFKFK